MMFSPFSGGFAWDIFFYLRVGSVVQPITYTLVVSTSSS